MTRAELLKVAKPILFNTEMVKAILEGRKTVTRRCVKYKYDNTEMRMYTDKYGTRLIEIQRDVEGETHGKNPNGSTWHKLLPYIEKMPPFKKGDILYVRESVFQGVGHYLDVSGETVSVLTYEFEYYADGLHEKDHWKDKYERTWMHRRPSIHMPKEAARIFLKVKAVRVEQLQDITPEQVVCEGTKEQFPPLAVDEFRDIWNSTINKSDLALYGWDTNPWVWVIEFERIEPDSDTIDI